jgi:hypothetical protein
MQVAADLTFTVDLGRGPISGRVEGDGTVLRITTDDADAVWEAASSVPEIGTAKLPLLADQLRDAGLRVEVVGPRGTVATLGSGAASTIGRLVTGSRAIQPGDNRAVAALLVGRIKRSRRGLILAAAVVAGAAGGVAVVVLRRR